MDGVYLPAGYTYDGYLANILKRVQFDLLAT